MFNKLKIALSILEIFLVSIIFANNILMSLDFNTLTTKGVVNGRGKFANTEYIVFDKANSIEIVQDDSKNRVLRIGRKNKVGGLILCLLVFWCITERVRRMER